MRPPPLGRRVINYLQWQSREAGEAAFTRFEQGGEDFWTLIGVHQARAVIFDSLQVLRSFERSHDDALHWRLNGEVQHPLALQVFSRSALVYRQFTDLDQARPRDVAAQTQQAGRVHLVVMAEAVSGA